MFTYLEQKHNLKHGIVLFLLVWSETRISKGCP